MLDEHRLGQGEVDLRGGAVGHEVHRGGQADVASDVSQGDREGVPAVEEGGQGGLGACGRRDACEGCRDVAPVEEDREAREVHAAPADVVAPGQLDRCARALDQSRREGRRDRDLRRLLVHSLGDSDHEAVGRDVARVVGRAAADRRVPDREEGA